MNMDDDALLIKRLQKGDEKAYVYLVDRYNRRLFGYALSLTNDHALAEDILQNVFLKTWEKRKKLNVHTSLQNYLFKSVYNEFINAYKKNRSTMILEHKYFEGLEKAVYIHNEQSFEAIIAQITKEIQNLPPKCQNIFILSKKEGLTNIEISEYLNVSIKTVEAQITKAFGILRKKLGNRYDLIMFLIFGSKIKGLAK
ncbi:RNA polymerase sigma-70 factor (ECF subfamily) [Arenibacter algicola]|uniref:RNA polymerase sigma-70 factor (ECF subfamily) n=1 Tax=Arenibacter algicola TaxID=616991 RepID=A0ABY3A9A2_9FLAO